MTWWAWYLHQLQQAVNGGESYQQKRDIYRHTYAAK